MYKQDNLGEFCLLWEEPRKAKGCECGEWIHCFFKSWFLGKTGSGTDRPVRRGCSARVFGFYTVWRGKS